MTRIKLRIGIYEPLYKTVKLPISDSVFLLLDNRGSYLNVEITEEARKNTIIILLFTNVSTKRRSGILDTRKIIIYIAF